MTQRNPGETWDEKRGLKDQTPMLIRPTTPDCSACKHPAIYHGRALPHCDACACAGYQKPKATT